MFCIYYRRSIALFVTFHDLKGKSVFITGGGSGIGASLTDGFLSQKAKVAIVQRSDAYSFCNEMEAKHGKRPLFFRCDISDVDDLQKAISSAASINGSIEVLVNNAANDMRHSIFDVTEEFWQSMQNINLKAYFFACQAVLPAMQVLGKGAIINFTSISYMMGNVGYPLYTMANAGLNGLTRSLAREFGPKGVRVNALAPGWVMTKKQIKLWVTQESLKNHIKNQCIQKPIQPEDIVGTALFLASDVSKMITGQTLVVDGGVVTTG
ncbi:SDR family NAD(P)-dependent oxidoreductase [Alphaproteobacteria bacterium]|nr:SDR family NAD(P)-dependent oxidoreductase [Alphaproteobacteria bacterium]